MKLGLENIRKLLAELGDPHERFKKVQVAGTNGKGSVCAFLDSVCRQAGISTGLYTSPHLVSITERIKIDGNDISEDNFARMVTEVRGSAEKLLKEGGLETRPTFFEHMTAVALLAFAEARVDLAILETGMGGRLDATTAANAEIAAITQIALDHQEYLGETLEGIAAEKAAIIQESTQALVIGRQKATALAVIRERLEIISFNPHNVRECSVTFDESALGNPIRKLPSEQGLLGNHQFENAETAVLLAGSLRRYFDITDDHIRLGLRNTRHPGRLEYVGNFLLDGAHNISGAEALRHFVTYVEKRPITMIFGAMKDKDVAEIAAVLWPRAEHVILTRPSNPRAMTSGELEAYAPQDVGKERICRTENVNEAITLARDTVTPNGIVLVTGSLYLVGEIRHVLAGKGARR